MTHSLPKEIVRPLYLLWLGRSGPGLTKEQLQHIGTGCFPGESGPSFVSFATMVAKFDTSSVADYLLSAGLASCHRRANYKITSQGAAVMKALLAESHEVDEHIVINPSAPFDYASLLNSVSDLDDLIVVDPYFHPLDLAQFADVVAEFTIITADSNVAKVPRFNKPALKAPARRSAFQEVLGQLGSHETQKIVYVSNTQLHDRLYLGSNGRGYLLGGSYKSTKLTIAAPLPQEFVTQQYVHFQDLINDGDVLTPTVVGS